MKKNIRIHKAEPNQGVLNYSHLLDAPAGKHGFVQVRKGHFYFADGTRARFIGFNVPARSNTPDHETADRMAERFASMGVNIIRLHAADCPIGDEPRSWSSCREAPLLDYEKGNGRNFHPQGLDRFDYFAAKLKEKGIYLHIDLLVGRPFLEGDELEYPGELPNCIKRFPMYNERLIELQKEYAKMLLCHVNPYTGMALIDDPAVVTIQINNEESAIKLSGDAGEGGEPYKKEIAEKFGDFLLMKYGTREKLKQAWTRDGVCALGEDEDPGQGTVRVIEGGFHQPVCNTDAPWDMPEGPPRYADFMEFGLYHNRRFYQMMKDYLHSLGAKVPIVCSNLLGGAADVYGHTDGDLMENNSYFNHPLIPESYKENTYLTAGPMEYVSVNPLTMQQGIGSMATTLLSFGSLAIVQGKPFMLSEWNEYGLHPFHSTAFVQLVSYACLNDWDGLILYAHHTSENWDDQPADEILNVFDAYNDPAVICQWGFMASVFLKGLVATAKNRVDVVHTQDDLLTLPQFHAMPTTLFPYVTAMRNVFLDGGEQYQGDADIAVNAGFLNGADLSEAKHGVYYAWSKYRDAMSRYREDNRLLKASEGGKELQSKVTLSEQALVFQEIREIAGSGDYRKFAELMDRAMKDWGIMEEDAGYVDGTLISDTKELIFDPDHARFEAHTPWCAYFSGSPRDEVVLSEEVCVKVKNERISISLLPVTDEKLADAEEFVLTAMGTTGMDETEYKPGPEMGGFKFTACVLRGKLYADTLEGILVVKARSATLTVLNPVGESIGEISGKKQGEFISFTISGEIPGVQYYLKMEKNCKC